MAHRSIESLAKDLLNINAVNDRGWSKGEVKEKTGVSRGLAEATKIEKLSESQEYHGITEEEPGGDKVKTGRYFCWRLFQVHQVRIYARALVHFEE